MTRAVLVGAAGRMGGEIIREMAGIDEIDLVGALEAPGHPDLGRGIFHLNGLDPEGPALVDAFDKVDSPFDVIVDFALPSALEEVLSVASDRGAALVIGSTGHSREQESSIREVAKRVPCVHAPNMSVGVNILFYLVGKAAKIAGEEFDIEVVETHHRFKQDAPSGTALRIARTAARARGLEPQQVLCCGRRGTGPREAREIGIHSIRGGDEVGEHRVIFDSMGERFEISHRARSRAIYARGAVSAALWVVGRSPGLYDMRDVLGLR